MYRLKWGAILLFCMLCVGIKHSFYDPMKAKQFEREWQRARDLRLEEERRIWYENRVNELTEELRRSTKPR